MHAAKIENSERLQRVDALLADGREYSTREIVELTGVLAVNSVIAELRANDRNIRSRQEKRVWFYKRQDIEAQTGGSNDN